MNGPDTRIPDAIHDICEHLDDVMERLGQNSINHLEAAAIINTQSQRLKRLHVGEDSIQAGIICPYCNRTAKLVDSGEVYAKSYGWMYLCRDCNAYVGCHKGTTTPLGRLANAELRQWKVQAHDAFDAIWKRECGGTMSRGDAYKWLGKVMNLPPNLCHIGEFDVEQCKRCIRNVAILKGNKTQKELL